MFGHILHRLALWVPSVLLVMLAVYALAFYGAGDPIKLIFLRAPGDVADDPTKIEAIREQAGLNRPFLVQFGSYIWNLLHGNFGNSLTSGRPVWNMVSAAAPVSLWLGLCAMIVTALVAIPLGMVAGMRQNSRLDYIILGTAVTLWAIPPYVAGPLLMVLLIMILPEGAVPYGWGGVFDLLILLPLTVLSFQPIALILRQTRAAVIEVMSEDYVRTARAKGVPEHMVALRHILRPVLTPVVTQLGLIMITIGNGAIFVELVFGLPGLGRLTVQVLINSDFPVILAITLIGFFLVMASNLLVDLLYPLLDARNLPPSLAHPFGTDDLGRDVISRVIYGARTANLVAICVTAIALAIGVILGAIAGFYGGMFDRVMMWFTDMTMSVPQLLLVVVINASLKQPIVTWMEDMYLASRNPIWRNSALIDFVLVFGSMTLISWPPYARLVRAQVLSIRNRPYVTAARAYGLTNRIIPLRYVLPNAMGPLIVAVSAGLGTAMVLESAFSFLGVGVNPPTPSWGNMISDGLRVWTNYPHLLVARLPFWQWSRWRSTSLATV